MFSYKSKQSAKVEEYRSSCPTRKLNSGCRASNYSLTSLICTTLFEGYGFGLFGKLQRYQLYGIVLFVSGRWFSSSVRSGSATSAAVPFSWYGVSSLTGRSSRSIRWLRATKIDGQERDVVRLTCPNRILRPTCEFAQHGIGKTIYRQGMV